MEEKTEEPMDSGVQAWCPDCSALTRLAVAELDPLRGTDGDIDFRRFIGTTICKVCGCSKCEIKKPLLEPDAT